MNKKIGNIYYVIDDIGSANFDLIGFLRAIKNLAFLRYLKSIIINNERPIGGCKIAYTHCLLLRKAGYNAIPIRMGRYRGDFYGFDIEPVAVRKVKNRIKSNDIIVATEFFPYSIDKFGDAIKVVFVQNWINLDRRLKQKDRQKNYLDIGYDHVMTCSDYVTRLVKQKMGIDAYTVTNGIDFSVFYSDSNVREEKRILCLPRKNPQDISRIKEIVLSKYADAEFVEAHMLTEAELADEYRKADIFLATGYPEGFGLPPLEAMACGCAVVGFTGGGASEFMIHNKTALVAGDGDCYLAAQHIIKLLLDSEQKEKLRYAGYQKSQEYSLDAMDRRLRMFFDNLGPEE